MTTRTLRLTFAGIAATLAALLFAGTMSYAATLTRPLIGGAIVASEHGSDYGIERVLLPAGRYYRQDAGFPDGAGGSVYTEATFCGPRLLLGVRDGDRWLLSDGQEYAHFDDPRIVPLGRPAEAVTVRVALYVDRGSADQVSVNAARASVLSLLPLYAALYTGGALTVEIEEAGEMTPGETTYFTNGIFFSGPDLLELRRAAGDDRVGLLLTPQRRHVPVRGLAYFDPLDARPGAYASYSGWFRKADLWRDATGLPLDERLSFDQLSGKELLELLADVPEEMNDVAVIAWHELLHVLEIGADPAFDVHDWDRYAHNGIQSTWFEDTRSVERSWYGLASWANLGEPLVEPLPEAAGCLEPMGASLRP